jgi:serine/threonine-protein kinase
VYELGLESERLFIAMELLQGQSLASICSRARDKGVRIDPALGAWIGARVADALHYAHHLQDDAGVSLGIIHRDISPQNIFVTYDGQVKIIDFGIARAKGRLVSTDQGKIRGKFRYMAPEQLLGSKFDERVDLFALCATVYEIVAGRPAFAGEDETDVLQSVLLSEVPDPRSVVTDIPERLATLLLQNLSPEPDQRAANGQQLAAAFDTVASESANKDLSQKLAALVLQLFSSEKAELSAAISKMARSDASVDSDPSALQPSSIEIGNTQLVAEAPSRPSKGRFSVIALAAAALVAGLSFAAWRVRFAPAVPAAASSVAIDISVQPAVDSEIRVDGKTLRGRSVRTYLAHASQPVHVEVNAPEFDAASLDFVPDRDQFIVVPLLRSAASSAPDAASSAPPPAAVVERPSKPDLRPSSAASSTGRSASPSPSPASSRPVSPGAIVTAYPL